MDEQSLSFFRQLLETPSPSGYEQPLQKVVRTWASQYADEVRHRCAWQCYCHAQSEWETANFARWAL